MAEMSGEGAEIRCDVMAKVMAEMGWDPESDVPMANEENIRLLKEVELLIQERSDLDEEHKQKQQRLKKLEQHSKNAELNIDHNLKLLNAFQSEVRAEGNLYKVAEREHAKLRVEVKTLDKEKLEVAKFLDYTEKELGKRRHGIELLTNRINWAKTVLMEWREAMNDGSKGFQLIERYIHDDQLKARQQDQRRQQLQSEIDTLRKRVIREYDEQKSLEQTLECAAKLYRSAHAERREMVETWKKAVTQMTQREQAIEQGEEDLVTLTKEANEAAETQRRYDEKLNEIMANNREVEATIEEMNGEISDVKERTQKLMDMAILREGEVDLVQKDLQNLYSRVQQQRAENRQSEKDKANKLQLLKDFDEIQQKLEERSAFMEGKSMNAQQRLQILEDMMDSEQKALAQLNHEIDNINSVNYRAQMQLRKLQDEIKTLEVDYDGVVVTTQAILKSTSTSKKQLERQSEIHYNLAYKRLEIERVIISLQGGKGDLAEDLKKTERLNFLEAELEDTQNRLRATELENRKLDDNMRFLTIAYTKDAGLLENLTFSIKEKQTYCTGSTKHLKTEKLNNQVRIVELSLLKIRANDYEVEISKTEEGVYNLEKHRALLIRTMKDRMVDIQAQMEILALKKKHINEEKSTLRADCGERNKHIDAVRSRFELASKLLGVNADGSLVTCTQLKVELAQEKQMLLDEGDDLNQKVLKAEAEIKAMENTLYVLNCSNDHYRKNVRRICDADAINKELESLKGNYCSALARLKKLTLQKNRIEKENTKACKRKAEVEQKLEMAINRRLANSESLARLQKEVEDQKVKIQRAEREVKLALRTLKRVVSGEFIALYDRDLDVRELEYRNAKALNLLADMADTDEEIGPKVVAVMLDRGVKMPHMLKKSRSVASWRSEFSELSIGSSKDILNSARSSISEETRSATSAVSARLSVVSIDFPK